MGHSEHSRLQEHNEVYEVIEIQDLIEAVVVWIVNIWHERVAETHTHNSPIKRWCQEIYLACKQDSMEVQDLSEHCAVGDGPEPNRS